MKLSKPKNITFLIALILGVLAIIGNFVAIPVISAYAFFILAVGFILLVLGVLVKGF